MKVAFLVLVSLAIGHAAVVPTQTTKKLVDTEWVQRQKNLIDLLIGVGHEETYKSEYESFDVTQHVDFFSEPTVVKDFVYLYKKGFLAKDAYFTLSCSKIRQQTIKLFQLFFYAKNFDNFYKVASWARTQFNGGQFAYAFYTAIYHRSDCQGFVLPPIYEVFPNLFVQSEYMEKIVEKKINGHDYYRLYLNNTGYENFYHDKMYNRFVYSLPMTYDQHVEDRLSYFREDVSLGDHITQFFTLYPSWVDQVQSEKISYFRRGELYYYFLQQLYARYSLERIAVGLAPPELLFYDRPYKVGYNSRLTSFAGHHYMPRPDNMIPMQSNPAGFFELQRKERRLIDSVSMTRFFNSWNNSYGQYWGKDGYEQLGNIIFGTPESLSKKYYGSHFYQALESLGLISQTGFDKGLVPSVIGNLITAPRDPIFYSYLQRIMLVFETFQKVNPAYSYDELSFPGVRVTDMGVSKLSTYFDRFDFDLTNMLPVGGQKTFKDYDYVAKQFRINHKPFTYNLTLTSEKSQKAIVRVFIGPKKSAEGHEFSIAQSKWAFVEFDRFPVELVNGENVIERRSEESTAYTEDVESFRSYYKRLEASLEKQKPIYVSESYRCGMSDRFLLPKGNKGGKRFVFYAIVSPYEEQQVKDVSERPIDNYVLCGGSKFYDGRAYGYPFDRKIKYERDFYVPNSYMRDIDIYHKDEYDNKV